MTSSSFSINFVAFFLLIEHEYQGGDKSPISPSLDQPLQSLELKLKWKVSNIVSHESFMYGESNRRELGEKSPKIKGSWQFIA